MIYPEDNLQRNRAIAYLYENGYSYGRIAREMRLTRNQVAGVINRGCVKRRDGVEHKRLPVRNGYTIGVAA